MVAAAYRQASARRTTATGRTVAVPHLSMPQVTSAQMITKTHAKTRAIMYPGPLFGAIIPRDMKTLCEALNHERRQTPIIGNRYNAHAILRFIHLVDDVEISNGELSALQRGQHGII